MTVGPALILSILVGSFHAAFFVLVRGSGASAMLLVWAAAILGAWAGDAIAGRLDVDPFRIGDFHVLAASVVAWTGIGFSAVASVLGPNRGRS